MRVAQLVFHRGPWDLPGRLDEHRFFDVPLALARAGVEVRLFYAGDRDLHFERGGAHLDFFAEHGLRATGGWLPPARQVEAALAFRPDVLHVQGIGNSAQLLYLGLRARAPIVVQDHAGRAERGLRAALQRRALGFARRALFVSAAQGEELRAADVLPRAIPIDEVLEGSTPFAPGDRAAARARLGIDGAPLVLWVGALDANKDPLTLLHGLRGRAGLVLAMVYRRAPLLDRVRALAAELGVEVRFLGARDHGTLELLHRAADLFVSTSRREGGSYSAIEALACGTTPVLSDIPAHRRITRGQAVGRLFAPGDPAALARAIDAALERPDREELRRFFEAELSLDRLAADLIGAYERAR